jgi:8-oxo-dGTP diphosphatase
MTVKEPSAAPNGGSSRVCGRGVSVRCRPRMASWGRVVGSGLAVNGGLLHDEIRSLVARLVPADALEAEHCREAVAWLDRTGDIFRRAAPRTPSPHLVSYFLLTDHVQGSVLLADHRKAGLWLPSGGHVEPGEHPVATVRREVQEELGVAAVFSPVTGERPMFVTVTETTSPVHRHTDVSLWFVLSSGASQSLQPGLREFREVRWWSRDDIGQADPALFDPHLNRMLAKFDRYRAAGTGVHTDRPFGRGGDRWEESLRVVQNGGYPLGPNSDRP